MVANFYVQKVFFREIYLAVAALLVADTACCGAIKLGKQECYLASSWVKEGPPSTSSEDWNENWFLFGVSKSIFQACMDFISYQWLLGTATFLKKIIFLFINTHKLPQIS